MPVRMRRGARVADLVVGSGPSGVSVASGLLARGRQVIMLDVGKRLEPENVARRDRMAAGTPEGWSAADRAAWQAGQAEAPPGGVRRYGSDFAMEPADATFAEGAEAFHLRASAAAGGLSNLWGSALLPYRAADMAGWPVSADDLAPHYRAITDFLPVSGAGDALEALFPALPMAGRTPLPLGPQARAFLGRYRTAAGPDVGATLGLARQAVAPGCRACGQCLHGCPWRLIWSAEQRLADLCALPGFSYRPGAPVRRFAEGPAGVTLTLADGATVVGERAFLAAGVLESARVLLASQPAGGALTLLDSQHGFLPAVARRAAPTRPDRLPLHTLAQLFLELDDPAISPYLVHAQIYGWNEFYAADLIRSYGRRLPGSAPLWRVLARRLMVAQVFLHSDHSARAELTLAPDGRLRARVTPPADQPARFRAAARRVGASLARGGLVPLAFAARVNPPGSSFHAGGTVPMARSPRPGQSDRLGRPHGLSRLHLADASVLPAIPATTITLPVMANAHRIATETP